MTDRNQPPTQIITSREALERLVDEYRCEKVVAFDLEADSMHHYREKVCLIQVATSSKVSLVDPLCLSDVAPLANLLADSSIRKVFHGADYDVRSMRRDFSMGIDNLFDTMIACQFLGEKEVGLAAVLRKRFGVELDKRFQKADWSKRPLAPDMIAYAIADTSLLVPLYRQLEEELRAKGRLSWVEEESALVSRAMAADRIDEPWIRGLWPCWRNCFIFGTRRHNCMTGRHSRYFLTTRLLLLPKKSPAPRQNCSIFKVFRRN
jgi:ribonuclease D